MIVVKTPVILRVLAQVFEVNRLLVVCDESLYLVDQHENALENERKKKKLDIKLKAEPLGWRTGKAIQG